MRVSDSPAAADSGGIANAHLTRTPATQQRIVTMVQLAETHQIERCVRPIIKNSNSRRTDFENRGIPSTPRGRVRFVDHFTYTTFSGNINIKRCRMGAWSESYLL
jgi:hypothetical protein